MGKGIIRVRSYKQMKELLKKGAFIATNNEGNVHIFAETIRSQGVSYADKYSHCMKFVKSDMIESEYDFGKIGSHFTFIRYLDGK